MGIVPMCGMIASCQAAINIQEQRRKEKEKLEKEKKKQEGGK